MQSIILVDNETKYSLIHATHLIPFMGISEIVEIEYTNKKVLENGRETDIEFDKKYKNMKFLCVKYPQNNIYEILDVLNTELDIEKRRKLKSPFPFIPIYKKDDNQYLSDYTNIMLIKDFTHYLYIPPESMLFHVLIDKNENLKNPLSYSIQNKITPIDMLAYPFEIGKIYACVYSSDHYSPLFQTSNIHSNSELSRRMAILENPVKIEIILKIFTMKI